MEQLGCNKLSISAMFSQICEAKMICWNKFFLQQISSRVMFVQEDSSSFWWNK